MGCGAFVESRGGRDEMRRVNRGFAQVSDRRDPGMAWLAWAVIGAGVALSGPVLGQSVPEVVRPRSDAPALPSGPSDGQAVRPRSENPLADGGGVRPIPDSGVVAPPAAGLGSTPVIKPPVTGPMPVIPPPGAPGGDRSVVPK